MRLDSKHCASSKYGAYFSLSTAQSACDSDPNCFGVYDYGCDDSNTFNLCPISEGLSDSATGSCVYEKTGSSFQFNSFGSVVRQITTYSNLCSILNFCCRRDDHNNNNNSSSNNNSYAR